MVVSVIVRPIFIYSASVVSFPGVLWTWCALKSNCLLPLVTKPRSLVLTVRVGIVQMLVLAETNNTLRNHTVI